MIDISKINFKEEPYIKFKELYEEALTQNQPNIEAACLSTLNKHLKEVDSRFVNIKYIKNNNWTFFSNYNSPKANHISFHEQISAVFFWSTINTQIRIKATIKKSSNEESDQHYLNRDLNKNALARSSRQSSSVESYEIVKRNFIKELNSPDINKRPEYWGGYEFTPYEFEFWRGHKNRLNKRVKYIYLGSSWNSQILQP